MYHLMKILSAFIQIFLAHKQKDTTILASAERNTNWPKIDRKYT